MSFQDGWVVEKTMYEYVHMGGCSCCGISHAFMDLGSFVQQCSDWETDDKKRENASPWPGFIHEEVLSDRIKIRQKMKNEIKFYSSFLHDMDELKLFQKFWSELDEKTKLRIFQVPIEDIQEAFKNKYDINSSYKIVLCAVLEQIKNFQLTGYEDGRVESELIIERNLKYERNAFTINSNFNIGPDLLVSFIQLLAGPKLLPSKDRKTKEDECGNMPENNELLLNQDDGQSFRPDRRLIRIVILRAFIDCAIRKYNNLKNLKTVDNQNLNH